MCRVRGAALLLVVAFLVCTASSVGTAARGQRVEHVNQHGFPGTPHLRPLHAAPFATTETLTDEMGQSTRSTPEKVVIHENGIGFVDFGFLSPTIGFGATLSRVLRTTDGMLTWTETTINDPSNRVVNIIVSPSSWLHSADTTVFFLGLHNVSWVTQDGGQTFCTLNTGRKLNGFRWHPSEAGWAVAQQADTSTLYLTQDFGVTWSLVRENVHDFSWCHAGIGLTPKERMCMITDLNTNEADGGGSYRLARSDSFGGDVIALLDLRARYLVVHPRLVFAIVEDVEGDNLYVSNDNGTSFQKALLPSNLKVPFFTPTQILDDTNALWIAVNHDDSTYGAVRQGNVYIGDTDGLRFTLALEHALTLNNWWDFEVVESVAGTYLANILVNWEDTTGPDAQGNNNVEVLARTMITFDNGDNWQYLDAPEDSPCSPNCNLNLFGKTTWLGLGGDGYFGDFYAVPEAVGLIMATGNVGTFLETEAESVNTYMSRDGGESWVQLMEGSTVYEYGDRGGLLVVAHNQSPTTTLYYSTDGGLSWSPLNFTQTPVEIISIFSLSTAGNAIVVFGMSPTGPMYFGLDFSGIHENVCTDVDYETWSPHDGEKRINCVLGRDTVLKRKKQGAMCFNPLDLDQVVSQTNCNCTINDYECDYDFERSELSGKCFRVATPDIVCQDDNTYLESQGYRRIPGDSCIHDLPQYMPVKKQCSHQNTNNPTEPPIYGRPNGLALGWILLIVGCLSVVIFIAILGGVVVGTKSKKVQQCLPWSRKTADGYSTQLIMEDEEE